MRRSSPRVTGLAMIAAALCSLLVSPRAASAGGPAGYVPGEVMVKLARAADLPAVAADYRLDPAPVDQFGSRPIYRLRILDAASPPDRAAAMVLDPRVLYAEPNWEGQAPEERQDYSWSIGGDAGGYTAQWAPQQIRLPEAHQITRGAGITVAVLDTGVDPLHPVLAGRLAPGWDFVDMDADPREVGVLGVDRSYGHGTHVAGLVALAAPAAQIMPVRVLNRQGVGNVWVLAEALRYAVDPDGNPATADGAGVINLSLSTPQRSRLLSDVLGAVTCADPAHMSPNDLPCFLPAGRGAVVVAAAGNSGTVTREYPAAEGVGGLLAVAASTQADTLAAFSTRGSWVNLVAPGQLILSSVPGGTYGTWSGTSMAAPLAAGTAALVRATGPGLNTAKVVQQLTTTAVRLDSSIPPRIDAAAAVGAGSAPASAGSATRRQAAR